MREIDKLRRSIPGAAPDCRFKKWRRPNPAQSVRKKAWWKMIKKKLAAYDRLKGET